MINEHNEYINGDKVNIINAKVYNSASPSLIIIIKMLNKKKYPNINILLTKEVYL